MASNSVKSLKCIHRPSRNENLGGALNMARIGPNADLLFIAERSARHLAAAMGTVDPKEKLP